MAGNKVVDVPRKSRREIIRTPVIYFVQLLNYRHLHIAIIGGVFLVEGNGLTGLGWSDAHGIVIRAHSMVFLGFFGTSV